MSEMTVFVELCCEETNTCKTRSLALPPECHTFLDIKKAVEKFFSIPVCVQTLSHQSNKMADSASLSSSYVRSGDTFQVSYPIEGDCQKVREIVKWLEKLADSLSHVKRTTPDGCVYRLEGIGYAKYTELISGEYTEAATDLSLNLVFPWVDKTKYVNKLHLDSLGGVKLLLSVYECLISARKSNVIMFRAHFLEMACALFIANFTQTFPLRRRILEYGGLGFCINSFLRSPVDGMDENVALLDAIEVALYAICNLSEVPECQLELAKRSDVTEQAIQVALSPMFSSKAAIVSTSYLLCLAQSPETHAYLLQPSIVSRMIDMCEIRRKECVIQNKTDAAVALESYACVVLAQMILGSSQYLCNFPEPLLTQILSLMETVCESNPVDIRTYEIEEGLIWGTFLPYMRYLYSPGINLTDGGGVSELITKIYQSSVSVMLHSLHNALGREVHVKILIEEGLLDYLVALPWNVASSSSDMARNMLKDVGKLTPIKPPSLCSLAKAKLAKVTMGLRKVMEMKSVSDLFLTAAVAGCSC